MNEPLRIPRKIGGLFICVVGVDASGYGRDGFVDPFGGNHDAEFLVAELYDLFHACIVGFIFAKLAILGQE